LRVKKIFKIKREIRVPKFDISEKVRVRKKEKIAQTLDINKKLDGCLFMNQMCKFCEKEFKVINIVRNVYYKKMLKTKKPLYMLQGVVCNGSSDEFGERCDRKCYLLWHEDWLEGMK